MNIPLEDKFTDVIAKAQKGLGISDEKLADISGCSVQHLKNAQEGEVDSDVLASIAPALGLKAEALINLALEKYAPQVEVPVGLQAFNTPYEDYTVNSYLIWNAKTREALVFDTGADATELLHFIAVEGLKVLQIFLTHTHGDHVFDLDRVVEKTRAAVLTPEREPIDGASPVPLDGTIRFGEIQVTSLLTNGHSPGGTTFFVEGLAVPVAIVGDSLFAGSMGGAATAWKHALTNNREKILTLPAETILCPGHGPMTSVGLEKANNPFFP